MSPEYFHELLTYGEADDYLGGMHRRYRYGYDQARMITSIIGQLFAQNYTPVRFPWEEQTTNTAPPTEEEMQDILQDAKAWEKRMNAKL